MEKDNKLLRYVLNIFFIIIFIVLLTTTLFLMKQTEKVKETYQWVKHSDLVIKNINNIFYELTNAESITRAFVITGNSSLIFNFDDKLVTVLDNLNTLQNLVQDNSEQAANLTKLKNLLQKRIELLKEFIKLKSSQILTNESALNIIYQAQALNVEIKTLIDEFTVEEEKLLELREEAFLQHYGVTSIIFNVINISIIVLLLLMIIIFNRMLNNLIRLRENAEKSESILKGIIGGSKEYIVAIDLNFDFMAFNPAYVSEFHKTFGKRPIIGKNIFEGTIKVPEQRKKGTELWARALKGEEFTVIEEFGTPPILKKYEITFSPIYNDTHQLIGASHIARDVSERIKDEFSLKKLNEELEESYEDIGFKIKEIETLNEMNNILRASQSLEETLPMVVLYLKKLLPECSTAIYLMDKTKKFLESRIEFNEFNDSMNLEKIFSPNECWALRQGKMYCYYDAKEDMSCNHFIETNDLAPYLCLPLLALNEVVGVLHLQIPPFRGDKERIENFLENRSNMIQNLAGQTALAISNIILQDFLKLQSTHDPLTNLYNRSYLIESFDRDLHRAHRSNTSIAVIMVDLDYFKNINDSYGHEVGDIVLREVSTCITTQLRKGDIACRYGGEEILIILYDINLETAFEKTEYLRSCISKMEFKFVDVLNITASFGIAMFPDDGQTPETLIKAADEALYYSKANGRNRVSIFNKI